MSYGPSGQDVWRRAGHYIDRILKGEEASNLPMEQPQVFRLTINAKTANALRLEIPHSLLARADEVVD